MAFLSKKYETLKEMVLLCDLSTLILVVLNNFSYQNQMRKCMNTDCKMIFAIVLELLPASLIALSVILFILLYHGKLGRLIGVGIALCDTFTLK